MKPFISLFSLVLLCINCELLSAQTPCVKKDPDTSWANTMGKTHLLNYGLQVFPNPCQDHVCWVYELATFSNVSLDLYDMHGANVAQVLDKVAQNSGKYAVRLPLHHLGAGIYVYHLRINGDVVVGKLMISN
jgi:hypothetical protein